MGVPMKQNRIMEVPRVKTLGQTMNQDGKAQKASTPDSVSQTMQQGKRYKGGNARKSVGADMKQGA